MVGPHQSFRAFCLFASIPHCSSFDFVQFSYWTNIHVYWSWHFLWHYFCNAKKKITKTVMPELICKKLLQWLAMVWYEKMGGKKRGIIPLCKTIFLIQLTHCYYMCFYFGKCVTRLFSIISATCCLLLLRRIVFCTSDKIKIDYFHISRQTSVRMVKTLALLT